MNDDDDECIICQDNDFDNIIINYNHTCGNYKVHQNCLDEWFKEKRDNCFVCRKNIIEDDIINNNIIENNHMELVIPNQQIILNQQNIPLLRHNTFYTKLNYFYILIFILLLIIVIIFSFKKKLWV